MLKTIAVNYTHLLDSSTPLAIRRTRASLQEDRHLLSLPDEARTLVLLLRSITPRILLAEVNPRVLNLKLRLVIEENKLAHDKTLILLTTVIGTIKLTVSEFYSFLHKVNLMH